MLDYFYSLEMLLIRNFVSARHWIAFHNSVFDLRELANEENQ